MIEHQISIFDAVETAERARTLRESTEHERAKADFESYCPVCGAALLAVKCKVVCRSEICVYRLIFNCSEF